MVTTLKDIANHPEYRIALKRYYESEAVKWLEIANKLCDGSEENLPRFAYAMRRYYSFKFDADSIL